MLVFEGSVSQLGDTSMLSSVTVGLMVLVDMTTSGLRSQCCFFEMRELTTKRNVSEYDTLDACFSV